MIKVLEHGIRKITCPYCKAKLQYEQEDIQEYCTKIEDLIEDLDDYQYIVCPDCGEKIILTPRKR